MFQLGIAPRYCLRELIAVFIVVFLVLLLISLGSRFTGYLQDAAAGEVSPELLWLILALRMPDFIQLVIPFSLFLAILLTLGRLDADSEMPIFQMANIGPTKFLTWFAWFVIPAVLVVGWFSFILTPDARARFLELITSQEVVSEFDVIKADTFRTFDEGRRVSYMGEVDRESATIGDVFLHQETPTGKVTILAQQGAYHVDPDSGLRFLELTKGQRYSQGNESEGFSVWRFGKLTQRIEVGAERYREDPSRIPTGELNAENPVERMEWHWRLAMPLMTLISAFVAVGLGRIKPRSGRFGKILPGLLFFVAYYGLTLGLMSQSQHSAQLAAMGFWPVHALMLLFGVYCYRKNWRPA